MLAYTICVYVSQCSPVHHQCQRDKEGSYEKDSCDSRGDPSLPVQDEKDVFKNPLYSIKTSEPEVNDTDPLPQSGFNLSPSHVYESLRNDSFLKPYSYESPSTVFEHDTGRYDTLELQVMGSRLAPPLRHNLTHTKREQKSGEAQSQVMGPAITLEAGGNVETDGHPLQDGSGADETEPQSVSHPYATLEPFDISTLEENS